MNDEVPREFLESVRDLRKAEKHYEHDRNEDNLTYVRNLQRYVDTLLKAYPKQR